MIHACREIGITTRIYLINGLPGEKEVDEGSGGPDDRFLRDQRALINGHKREY